MAEYADATYAKRTTTATALLTTKLFTRYFKGIQCAAKYEELSDN